MRRLFQTTLMLLSLGLVSAFAAASDQKVIEDQVSFQVAAQREVLNDRAVATLSASAEDNNPANLAGQINDAMTWALKQVKVRSGVASRSGAYRTYPVYDDRRIVRWRGSQELRLESGDMERLAQLIGKLQERLQVQSMQFLISADKRQEVEAGLTQEALGAFRQRADLICKALGASGYRLMDISVTTGGHRPPVPVYAEAVAAGRAALATPAIEQGTGTVTVQVSGRIQLLRE
ncbi:MAG: SIMPL domain-containing protein [Gammaproteobacteria bacterium]|jgi:predicted secreted protein